MLIFLQVSRYLCLQTVSRRLKEHLCKTLVVQHILCSNGCLYVGIFNNFNSLYYRYYVLLSVLSNIFWAIEWVQNWRCSNGQILRTLKAHLKYLHFHPCQWSCVPCPSIVTIKRCTDVNSWKLLSGNGRVLVRYSQDKTTAAVHSANQLYSHTLYQNTDNDSVLVHRSATVCRRRKASDARKLNACN